MNSGPISITATAAKATCWTNLSWAAKPQTGRLGSRRPSGEHQPADDEAGDTTRQPSHDPRLGAPRREARGEALADQPGDDQHHTLDAEGDEQRQHRLAGELPHAVPGARARRNGEQESARGEDRELPVGGESRLDGLGEAGLQKARRHFQGDDNGDENGSSPEKFRRRQPSRDRDKIQLRHPTTPAPPAARKLPSG
jgi:hypothetical protein